MSALRDQFHAARTKLNLDIEGAAELLGVCVAEVRCTLSYDPEERCGSSYSYYELKRWVSTLEAAIPPESEGSRAGQT